MVEPQQSIGSVVIAGGAGFIGSSIGVRLLQKGWKVTSLDNLSRRGSDALMRRVTDLGGQFVHGDIRCPEDFRKLTADYSAFIDCSAEPSVLAGAKGDDALFMLNNNLVGSIHCFEFARVRRLPLLFLSTSRVYPYPWLNGLHYREAATRIELADAGPGVSAHGVTVDAPLHGVRSLYGASKLASELILQEYCHHYDFPAIINRCGVIAGPWQLGKVDQGVFTHWLVCHYFGKPLNYVGFGGTGKQVRDLLHIEDLTDLIVNQLQAIHHYRGAVFNVGGGARGSLSLLETTAICQALTGKKIPIGPILETRPADVPWYVTDSGATETAFQWAPQRLPDQILKDTFDWLRANEALCKGIFVG